jgi:hypothetical protein
MVSGFQADAWIRNNTKQIKIIPLSKYKKKYNAGREKDKQNGKDRGAI